MSTPTVVTTTTTTTTTSESSNKVLPSEPTTVTPPPNPSPLPYLYLLPDILQDIIFSFLYYPMAPEDFEAEYLEDKTLGGGNSDLTSLMRTSRHGLHLYGSRVKRLHIHGCDKYHHGDYKISIMMALSILSRLPGLKQLYLNVSDPFSTTIQPWLYILADGACPYLDTLLIGFHSHYFSNQSRRRHGGYYDPVHETMKLLSNCLQARAKRGNCSAIKFLSIASSTNDDKPSSGSCKLPFLLTTFLHGGLEVLHLGSNCVVQAETQKVMAKWMWREQASALRELAIPRVRESIVQALASSPCIVPSLQALRLNTFPHHLLPLLAKATKEGQWRHTLKSFKLTITGGNPPPDARRACGWRH